MNKLERLARRLKMSSKDRASRLAELFPPEKIERIKRRERRRFREAQDRKWENWLDSMSK